jgi:hypothetical protein
MDVIKIETLLKEMIAKYSRENITIFKDGRLGIYADHYGLIFDHRKYPITCTIKLNLDFSLIDVCVFVDKKNRISDVALAKKTIRARFVGFHQTVEKTLKMAGV